MPTFIPPMPTPRKPERRLGAQTNRRPTIRLMMPTRTTTPDGKTNDFKSFRSAWLFHFYGQPTCTKGLRELAPIYRADRSLIYNGVIFTFLPPTVASAPSGGPDTMKDK
jgi:hypothetical protein